MTKEEAVRAQEKMNKCQSVKNSALTFVHRSPRHTFTSS
ncbi:hypothetical protein DOT_0003 [Desulfosporosinus sp. OT]|nr:hypothetical protein DOT_0003 [Desulfosporosinus sp. OT]